MFLLVKVNNNKEQTKLRNEAIYRSFDRTIYTYLRDNWGKSAYDYKD